MEPQAGPGIAPSASLIRVQTFMSTTTPTISRIFSGLKFSASPSWKRWNAASRSVSAARVSASVYRSAACSAAECSSVSHHAVRVSIFARGMPTSRAAS
jgi:hypothetical protein